MFIYQIKLKTELYNWEKRIAAMEKLRATELVILQKGCIEFLLYRPFKRFHYIATMDNDNDDTLKLTIMYS